MTAELGDITNDTVDKRDVSRRITRRGCLVVFVVSALLCASPWLVGIARNRLNYLKWSTNNVHDYIISVQISNLDHTKNVLLTVRDGIVTEVKGGLNLTSPPGEFQQFAIEELFDMSLFCVIFICETEYDGTYGFPTFMTQRLLELGSTIRVSDFRKLP